MATMTVPEDHDSLAGWLAGWGECIAGLVFARGWLAQDGGNLQVADTARILAEREGFEPSMGDKPILP